MQDADVALGSIFDGGPRAVEVGQARVAHRLHRGDRAEQANAHMAAHQSLSLGAAAPDALHTQDGRPLSEVPLRDFIPAPAPDVAPVAWAIGAASTPEPPAVPVPVRPTGIPSIHSIAFDDARGCHTPLRRDDARRIIDSLDSRSSHLSTMQSVARAAELTEIRLSCGPPSAGSTVNRTKAHVLADMRKAVGLDPTAVPMGIPMQTEGGEGSTQSFAPSPSTPVPPQAPPPQAPWTQGTMASRRTAAGCTCADDSASLELCSTCHAAWWCTGCFAAQCPCVMEDVRRLHAAADTITPVQKPAPAVQQATALVASHFGFTGFEARGGAEIAGSQIVADHHGDLATCHSVRLTDGGILRATCPISGPTVTADTPPPGSIYLGSDLADTRVWATLDGKIIATARRVHSVAELTQPPSPPGSWMSLRTVCFTALILLTHLLVIGVAVGWSAGRPSTGMGHITGLPDAPHDAGALALRAFNLLSLPSAMRSASWLVGVFGYSVCTAARTFGYIGATMLSACSPLTALLSQAITSLPVQRFISCQGCTLSLAAATLRAIARVTWAYGVGPTLATLGYVTGGALGATACTAATCVTTWVTYSVLLAIPSLTRTLALGRLRRAWGRVSPLILPGSPPPWDTSAVFTRRSDYIHRPNWEGRFAGARRTCYSHLVSAMSQWHLPWWLLVLALQWAVVALPGCTV